MASTPSRGICHITASSGPGSSGSRRMRASWLSSSTAGAIQNLTLDGRAIDHFLRNELDHDPLPSIAVEMVHRSDYDTGTLEESLLGLPQQRRVEAESGPVGELPIPEHDRLSAFLSIMLSTNRDL